MNPPEAPCPHCGAAAAVDTINPYRPFCSRRCRLLDLGGWLDGSHRIPTDEPVAYYDSEDGDDLKQH
ncbi:MAG: DNA gyrase inhibitor YacG, partial [Salinisphaera sp.]|nr:DNA gyrase inhibitor YacG [Salinisphaera sp.]